MRQIHRLGLLGKGISYSFSKNYFDAKFREERVVDFEYGVYDMSDLSALNDLLKSKSLVGLNVTTPYKEAVIPYLDETDATSHTIGAVNTIAIKNGKRFGFNTDVIGFEVSLRHFIQGHNPNNALILGTGGASKAVSFVLKKCGIAHEVVSRTPTGKGIGYHTLPQMKNFTLIINTTPLGVKGNENTCPDLPYHELDRSHFLFDLTYNPAISLFLQKGLDRGTQIKNGLEMLQIQADASWRIWKDIA